MFVNFVLTYLIHFQLVDWVIVMVFQASYSFNHANESLLMTAVISTEVIYLKQLI